RRLDHGDRAVGPNLCLLGIERHQEVKARAGVGVHRGEDRWVLGDLEVGLIQRYWRGVLWIGFLKAVALERTPALIAKPLVFPQTRKAGFGQLGAGHEDAGGVAAEQPAHRAKAEALGRSKLEADTDQMLPAQLLEEMSACEDVAGLRELHRGAHPVVLHAAQAFVADRARPKIFPCVLFRWFGLLDERIYRDADRLFRQLYSIEVQHGTSQRRGEIVGC